MSISSHEENVATVIEVAKASLSEVIGESGTVLYSESNTLRPGKFYFLGLNPGGSDEETNSIERSLRNLSASTPNAYLDEDWSSPSRHYGKGGHPLQKNFAALFAALGEDPRAVCASNLIFSRSIREQGAGGTPKADLCWPVHLAILHVVRPEAIIAFGRLPFDFVVSKLGGTALENHPAKHGKWVWRSSILQSGQKLVGLPHLSRYSLVNRPSVMEEIARFVETGSAAGG